MNELKPDKKCITFSSVGAIACHSLKYHSFSWSEIVESFAMRPSCGRVGVPNDRVHLWRTTKETLFYIALHFLSQTHCRDEQNEISPML